MSHAFRTGSSRLQVLVVGMGPVGAALSALLGRYGVRAVVVDRAAGILEHPRAIALDHEALRILQNVGLSAGAFDVLPVPFVSMRSTLAGEFARMETAGALDGHPKQVTFYQPDLERALRARLETLPTVATMVSTELLNFVQTPDGIVATLRGPDQQEFEIEADYLVAADGANSEIRKNIGLEFEGQTYAEDWLIVDVLGASEIEHVEFTCDPARPSPRMRAPGGRMRWEFMLHAGESPEAMRAPHSVRRLLAPWVDMDAIEIERSAVYRFKAQVANCFSCERVFLAGDAAHLTPPFAGQGLVAGLRDAFNLAWKLAWVCRNGASPAILESYDIERRPHAEAMVALARRMGHLIMPSSPVQARVVQRAVKSFRRTRLGRAVFDEQRGKPCNRIASGLVVDPGAAWSTPRGAQLPQFAAELETGTCLSDDLLGPFLTLVVTGAGEAPLLDAALTREFEQAGGRIVHFDAFARAADSCELRGPWRAGSRVFASGRAFIVRPDRMVMHEGPLDHAPRLVRQALAMLRAGCGQTRRRDRALAAIRTRGAMYG